MWYNGHPFWRSAPWVGQKFIGIPGMYNSVYLKGITLQDEGDGTFTLSSIQDPDIRLTYILTSDGKFTEQFWDYEKQGWEYTLVVPLTDCDFYGKCGAFGRCDAQNSPICRCLDGNGSEVGKEDGFMKLETMKVPTFAEYWSYLPSSGYEQACKDECLKNCSCVAYSYYNGFGCMAWTGNLIDIQKFPEEGTDLNIRLAYTELGNNSTFRLSERKLRNEETLSFKTREAQETVFDENLPENVKEVKLEPLFKLQVLETATQNFHISNMLGQGGFGAVYRVTLLE
ncbi:hypothetical protein OIU84_002351 [Salix udensis]|uniref:Apple domain-containing protein n=1 Tax=Salix udensis TaxID=889485 RepID=A0AAD6P4J0_9ROSI|nr:hypothetical protein OIU84_002351 [Salix udensis]